MHTLDTQALVNAPTFQGFCHVDKTYEHQHGPGGMWILWDGTIIHVDHASHHTTASLLLEPHKAPGSFLYPDPDGGAHLLGVYSFMFRHGACRVSMPSSFDPPNIEVSIHTSLEALRALRRALPGLLEHAASLIGGKASRPGFGWFERKPPEGFDDYTLGEKEVRAALNTYIALKMKEKRLAA